MPKRCGPAAHHVPLVYSTHVSKVSHSSLRLRVVARCGRTVHNRSAPARLNTAAAAAVEQGGSRQNHPGTVAHHAVHAVAVDVAEPQHATAVRAHALANPVRRTHAVVLGVRLPWFRHSRGLRPLFLTADSSLKSRCPGDHASTRGSCQQAASGRNDRRCWRWGHRSGLWHLSVDTSCHFAGRMPAISPTALGHSDNSRVLIGRSR